MARLPWSRRREAHDNLAQPGARRTSGVLKSAEPAGWSVKGWMSGDPDRLRPTRIGDFLRIWNLSLLTCIVKH